MLQYLCPLTVRCQLLIGDHSHSEEKNDIKPILTDKVTEFHAYLPPVLRNVFIDNNK